MAKRRRYRRNPVSGGEMLGLAALGAGVIYLMSQSQTNAALASAAASSTTGGQVASVLTAGSSLANALSQF